MKTRIAIAIVFFVAGVIALDIYRKFGPTAKIEKCADKNFYAWIVKESSKNPIIYGNQKIPKLQQDQNWGTLSLDEKIKDRSFGDDYVRFWKECEKESNNYPKLFNKKY
jgi:hypothetical protein